MSFKKIEKISDMSVSVMFSAVNFSRFVNLLADQRRKWKKNRNKDSDGFFAFNASRTLYLIIDSFYADPFTFRTLFIFPFSLFYILLLIFLVQKKLSSAFAYILFLLSFIHLAIQAILFVLLLHSAWQSAFNCDCALPTTANEQNPIFIKPHTKFDRSILLTGQNQCERNENIEIQEVHVSFLPTQNNWCQESFRTLYL